MCWENAKDETRFNCVRLFRIVCVVCMFNGSAPQEGTSLSTLSHTHTSSLVPQYCMICCYGYRLWWKNGDMAHLGIEDLLTREEVGEICTLGLTCRDVSLQAKLHYHLRAKPTPFVPLINIYASC